MAKKAIGPKIFLAFSLLTAIMAGLGYYFKEQLPPWALVLIVASPPAVGCFLYALVRSTLKEEGPKAPAAPPPKEAPEEATPSAKPEPSSPPPASAVEAQMVVAQVLSLLQNEGRLLDFLNEDLDRYDDAQIGAAVRVIHKGLKSAVSELVRLAPVVEAKEGTEVTVEEGFDPQAIRLTGNIHGNPPFKGILRHRGWRYLEIKVPGVPSKSSDVITPAEVEVG